MQQFRIVLHYMASHNQSCSVRPSGLRLTNRLAELRFYSFSPPDQLTVGKLGELWRAFCRGGISQRSFRIRPPVPLDAALDGQSIIECVPSRSLTSRNPCVRRHADFSRCCSTIAQVCDAASRMEVIFGGIGLDQHLITSRAYRRKLDVVLLKAPCSAWGSSTSAEVTYILSVTLWY